MRHILRCETHHRLYLSGGRCESCHLEDLKGHPRGFISPARPESYELADVSYKIPNNLQATQNQSKKP